MRFTFAHNNINVLDLDRSLAFYKEALGLEAVKRHEAKDGSFILVYLGGGCGGLGDGGGGWGVGCCWGGFLGGFGWIVPEGFFFFFWGSRPRPEPRFL